jgi:hypothetical protein
MKKALILGCFLSILLPALEAESDIRVKLSNSAVLLYEDSLLLAGLSLADIDFNNSGSREIKSSVSLRMQLSTAQPLSFLELRRAWVKFRLPDLRITLGKTRISWGEGFYFNAGDLIHGSLSLKGNLGEDEIRDNSDWLIAANYPLSTFSFIEAVALPPVLDASDPAVFSALPYGPFPEPDAEDSRAGARIYLTIADIVQEIAYLYDQGEHVLAYGGQFNLFFDIYYAARLELNSDQLDLEDLQATIGIFHSQSIGYSDSLSLRLESLIRPFKPWEETSLEEEVPLFLFTDFSYAFLDRFTLSLRSTINPIDLSGFLFPSLGVELYKGFTINLQGTFTLAESGDLFDSTDWPDYGALVTFRYIY